MSIIQKIIVVLGPTASGKSELAVRLAQGLSGLKRSDGSFGQNSSCEFLGEVVSADSRQVYKGLDIGTGKAPRDKNTKFEIRNPKQIQNSNDKKLNFRVSNLRLRNSSYEYKGVRHHLIDVISPKEVFTVADYRRLTRKAIADIYVRGKLPIICGGTGFYIDAALYDYPLPEAPPDLKLRKELERESIGTLFEKLKELDPERASSIDRDNRRRLIRALEIVMKSGRPVPKFNILKNIRKSDFLILKIGIRKEAEELRRLIFERLIKRLDEGMVEEVESLYKEGLSWKRMEELGLEYRYVSRFLRGLITRDEMIKALNKEIWHYAKRQMTWFKRDKEIHWVSKYDEAEKLVKNFVSNSL